MSRRPRPRRSRSSATRRARRSSRGSRPEARQGGRRVGELIGKLPGAPALLVEAFAGPAVNTQVNAALALGMLGADRVGPGMAALLGARTGGDSRTRDAVRRALDMLGPKGPSVRRPSRSKASRSACSRRPTSRRRRPRSSASASAISIEHLRTVAIRCARMRRTALGVLGPAAAGAARSLGVLLAMIRRACGSQRRRRSTSSATQR